MGNYATLDEVMDKSLPSYNLQLLYNEQSQIWLVLNNGIVLINNINKQSLSEISVKDVTISERNITDALKEIENQWGIFCDNTNLSPIYSFDTQINKKEAQINGYALFLNLNQEYIDSILLKGSYMLLDYRNLEDLFNLFKKDMNFKESFYSLIYELEKKFNSKIG